MVKKKKRIALKTKFDRKGFLKEVVNPRGKGTAVIVQRVKGKTGFTALSGKTNRKIDTKF